MEDLDRRGGRTQLDRLADQRVRHVVDATVVLDVVVDVEARRLPLRERVTGGRYEDDKMVGQLCNPAQRAARFEERAVERFLFSARGIASVVGAVQVLYQAKDVVMLDLTGCGRVATGSASIRDRGGHHGHFGASATRPAGSPTA